METQKYIVTCHVCGVKVERERSRNNAICFECNRSRANSNEASRRKKAKAQKAADKLGISRSEYMVRKRIGTL